MRKPFRAFFRGFLWILGFILLIQLVVYFLAPIYDFQEPEPFSGNRWYNPYHDIDTNHWHRANFHFHTQRWGGITSGSGTEQDVHEQYRQLGYSVSALSHYQYITAFRKDSPDYIPVHEHGFGIRKKHQLLIGARDVLWFDYPLIQNVHHKQHIINLLRPASEIVVLAHPDWENGYTPEEMSVLSNYDLIEALNNNWNSLPLWDAALSAGRPVFILGSDDGHDIFDPYVVGRRCTFINSPSLNSIDLLENLKSGNAFGADVYMRENESFAEKESRIRWIPTLTGVTVSGDTLRVSADTVAMKFTFIGQGGKARKVQYRTSEGWYRLQPEDTYIRTEITFFSQYKHPGTVFYLNPVFRYAGEQPVNRLTASVNQERTWIFRIMTLGALTGIVYLLIRSRLRRSRTKPSAR